MSRKELIENRGIVFDAKPDAVPYNYRISYKVSQICLIIAKSCRGKSGCLPVKLHMISFALCSKNAIDRLIDFARYDIATTPIVRFDPAINKAVAFAIADNLIFQGKNGKYCLTDKGIRFVNEIDNEPSVLCDEKMSLGNLSKKLTDEKIKELSNIWREQNAED